MFNKSVFYFLLLGTVLFLSNCSTKKFSAKSMVSISLDYAAGMTPKHYDIELKKDKGLVNYYETQGKKIKQAINLDENEWLKLIQVLNENKAAKISTYKMDKVYDRGGYTVTIITDSDTITIRNEGQNFVTDEFKANFDSIQFHIRKLVEGKTDLDL